MAGIILQAIEDQSKEDKLELDQDYFNLYCTEVTLAWLWMSLGQFEKFQQRFFSNESEISDIRGNQVDLNACPQGNDHLYKGVTILWWIVALACQEMEKDTPRVQRLYQLVIDVFEQDCMADLNLAAAPKHSDYLYSGITVFWWITKLTCHAIENNSQQAGKLCALLKKRYEQIYTYSDLEPVPSQLLNAAPSNEHYFCKGKSALWWIVALACQEMEKDTPRAQWLCQLVIDVFEQDCMADLNLAAAPKHSDYLYSGITVFWWITKLTCHAIENNSQQAGKLCAFLKKRYEKIYNSSFNPVPSNFLNAAPSNEHYLHAGATVFWMMAVSTCTAIQKQNENAEMLLDLMLEVCRYLDDVLHFNACPSKDENIYQGMTVLWVIVNSARWLTKKDDSEKWMENIKNICRHEHLDFNLAPLNESTPNVNQSILMLLVDLRGWDVILLHSLSSKNHTDRIISKAKEYANLKAIEIPSFAFLEGLISNLLEFFRGIFKFLVIEKIAEKIDVFNRLARLIFELTIPLGYQTVKEKSDYLNQIIKTLLREVWQELLPETAPPEEKEATECHSLIQQCYAKAHRSIFRSPNGNIEIPASFLDKALCELAAYYISYENPLNSSNSFVLAEMDENPEITDIFRFAEKDDSSVVARGLFALEFTDVTQGSQSEKLRFITLRGQITRDIPRDILRYNSPLLKEVKEVDAECFQSRKNTWQFIQTQVKNDKTTAVNSRGIKRRRDSIFTSVTDVPQTPDETGAGDGEPLSKKRKTEDPPHKAALGLSSG
jgi:hypothetical protein